MKKILLSIAIMIGVGFIACTNKKNSNSKTQKIDSTTNKITKDMKNLVSIVEIPTADFSRAVKFYKSILDINIQEIDMDGVQMGLLPSNGETVNVVLVKGNDYKPSINGTIVYLNTGDDLQVTLNKVEKNGGKVVVPKTKISSEMGFFAMFTDTEENKLGLHSQK
jgi:uncharacterized protein